MKHSELFLDVYIKPVQPVEYFTVSVDVGDGEVIVRDLTILKSRNADLTPEQEKLWEIFASAGFVASRKFSINKDLKIG